MFYCDEDAERAGWPVMVIARSYGLCEVCGKTTECNDVPAVLLPTASSPEQSQNHE